MGGRKILCRHLIGSVSSWWYISSGVAYGRCCLGRGRSRVSSPWPNARLLSCVRAPPGARPLLCLRGPGQANLRHLQSGVLLKPAGFQSSPLVGAPSPFGSQRKIYQEQTT